MFLFHSFPDNPSSFICILFTVKHWAYKIAASHSLSYVLVAPHPSVWAVEFLCRHASLCVYSCEVGVSPSGFSALLWSSFPYLTWNNLVLLRNSQCFVLIVIPAFCSLSPHLLAGQLLLVGATHRCLSPFVWQAPLWCWADMAGTEFHARYEQKWQTLQRCIPLLSSRANLSISV